MDQLAQLLMNRHQDMGRAPGGMPSAQQPTQAPANGNMWGNLMAAGNKMGMLTGKPTPSAAGPAVSPQGMANYAAVNKMAQMAPPATPVAQMAPPVAAGPKQLPSAGAFGGAFGGVLGGALNAAHGIPGGSPVAARLQGIMQKLMMHRQQGMHVPQDTGSAMHAAPAGPTPGMMIPSRGF